VRANKNSAMARRRSYGKQALRPIWYGWDRIPQQSPGLRLTISRRAFVSAGQQPTGRDTGHHEIAKQRSSLRSSWITASSRRSGGKTSADEKGEPKRRHAACSRPNPALTRGDSPSKGPTNGTTPIPVLKKKKEKQNDD
jgi:hypothetical protein